MNLQAFGISALECLQSQNLSHPENRLSLKALAIVHGRRAKGQTDVAKGPKTAGETLMSLVDQLVGIIGFLEYTIST